jgi:hypothetical protein
VNEAGASAGRSHPTSLPRARSLVMTGDGARLMMLVLHHDAQREYA